MELQTHVPLDKAPIPISYDSEIMLLGSCFANHIASRLTYFQFRNRVNPFGTLFHPQAITNLIIRSIKGKKFRKEELIYHQESWHSFEVHSEMSRAEADDLLTGLNTGLQELREFLLNASHLVITLGTAWGYKSKDKDSWVANCHKVPQSEFTKILSTPADIKEHLFNALTAVFEINPEIGVLFTVSPVRHLKDGFVENQRSKAHLMVAVHELVEQFSNEKVYYFPSYELMMDELRDYRFYEADMVHPNALAVNYIWEKFSPVCIDDKEHAVMLSVEEIRKGLAHIPFNPHSEANKAFKLALGEKIDDLRKRYPFMKFE
ncbi:GSCFA domain-containing protein [Muriicola sp. SD30]|uniref:GSCFA domain-containing protein n=1 Tax=Muriicola sp. SD30 TaxID=3240936 RepID=UPI00350FB806